MKRVFSKQMLPWLKKITIFLGCLAIVAACFSFLITSDDEGNKKTLLKKMEEIFAQQQSLTQELSQLLKEKKFKQAKPLIPTLKENNLELLSLEQQLNQLVKNHDSQNKEIVLKNNFEFLEKIEACLNFYPDEKEKFQDCQEEIIN